MGLSREFACAMSNRTTKLHTDSFFLLLQIHGHLKLWARDTMRNFLCFFFSCALLLDNLFRSMVKHNAQYAYDASFCFTRFKAQFTKIKMPLQMNNMAKQSEKKESQLRNLVRFRTKSVNIFEIVLLIIYVHFATAINIQISKNEINKWVFKHEPKKKTYNSKAVVCCFPIILCHCT